MAPPDTIPTAKSKRHAKSRDLGVNRPVMIPLMPATLPFINSINVADIPNKMPHAKDSQGTVKAISTS
ncbi:hypothetical protein AKJ18_22565 [Vibrio xuii]|nr:hypothetical protein AKJ18_22565 [Vibrio xuii]